jgi:hypothetical protein
VISNREAKRQRQGLLAAMLDIHQRSTCETAKEIARHAIAQCALPSGSGNLITRDYDKENRWSIIWLFVFIALCFAAAFGPKFVNKVVYGPCTSERRAYVDAGEPAECCTPDAICWNEY